MSNVKVAKELIKKGYIGSRSEHTIGRDLAVMKLIRAPKVWAKFIVIASTKATAKINFASVFTNSGIKLTARSDSFMVGFFSRAEILFPERQKVAKFEEDMKNAVPMLVLAEKFDNAITLQLSQLDILRNNVADEIDPIVSDMYNVRFFYLFSNFFLF